MCGICGYINFEISSDSSEIILSMVNTLKHRGPDDKGFEIINKSEYQLALGHTRLSIIDVSSLGHQPMIFDEFMIVFNGEFITIKKSKLILKKKVIDLYPILIQKSFYMHLKNGVNLVLISLLACSLLRSSTEIQTNCT